MNNSEFKSFLADEVSKVKGIYYPVKTGVLRRFFIRKAPRGKLHPNPNDEFCFPDIGPNYEIISRYKKAFSEASGSFAAAVGMTNGGIREPIMVVKTRPDGYMILNGHHRWAAAHIIGVKKLPIRIIDPVRLKYVRKLTKKSRSERRVTLDLDEVIFCAADGPAADRSLPLPLKRMQNASIRLGIPALLYELGGHDYDIWIYTSQYYSLELLNFFLMRYQIPIAGIVTGAERKQPKGPFAGKEEAKNPDTEYKTTFHIDSQAILRVKKDTREFEEYRLSGSPETWSREVLETLERINPA